MNFVADTEYKRIRRYTDGRVTLLKTLIKRRYVVPYHDARDVCIPDVVLQT